jgi:heat shock protein HslJ
MTNMRGRLKVGLVAVLCAAGPLFAQAPASTDVRAELAKVQDIEYQLGDALVNGVRTVFAGQPSPSISFHSGDIISGYAGVNRYYATIRVMPDGAFNPKSPGFAITKLTGVPERMDAEAAFLAALQATRFIRIESDGIAFESDDSATRLKFTPVPVTLALSDLLNVELVLVRFVSNGKDIPIPSGVTITLMFQDQGRMSGRSAVNNYAGVFTVMPDGQITVQATMATAMAGPPELMALEATYFEALPLLRQVRLKTDRVVLEGGTTSMEFTIGSRR